MPQRRYSERLALSNRKHEQRRRKSAAVAAVALVGVLAIGGTMAWIFDRTDEVENTFQPVEVTCMVDEKIEGDVKKDVKVVNTGDVDAFIRAAVVINWVDINGDIVGELPEGYGYTTSSLPASAKWVKGTDGYFYYTELVEKDGVTENLIDSIASTYSGEGEQTCFLSVEILASAIQADGSDGSSTPVDSWDNAKTDVTRNADGSLSIASK